MWNISNFFQVDLFPLFLEAKEWFGRQTTLTGADGRPRNWILEIHFIDRERQIGGFFEQLLT